MSSLLFPLFFNIQTVPRDTQTLWMPIFCFLIIGLEWKLTGTEPPSPWLLVCVLNSFSCVRLFATLWTVAHQAPPSMGFSRQESWSALPRSSPGDIPDPGIKPTSLMSPALAGGFFTTSATFGDGDKGVCSKRISRPCGHKLVGYFLKQRKYSYPMVTSNMETW